MNVEDMSAADIDITGEKSVADRWILSRLNETVAKVTELSTASNLGKPAVNCTTLSGMISVTGTSK